MLDPLYKLATCALDKKKDAFKIIWESSQLVRDSFKDAKTCLGVNAKHTIRLRDIIHETIKKNDTLKMEHIGLCDWKQVKLGFTRACRSKK